MNHDDASLKKMNHDDAECSKAIFKRYQAGP